jgi:hypothetical protein
MVGAADNTSVVDEKRRSARDAVALGTGSDLKSFGVSRTKINSVQIAVFVSTPEDEVDKSCVI